MIKIIATPNYNVFNEKITITKRKNLSRTEVYFEFYIL